MLTIAKWGLEHISMYRFFNDRFWNLMHPCVILVMLGVGKPERKENKFI